MLSNIVGKEKFKFDFEGTNVQALLDEIVHKYGTEARKILYGSRGAFNPNIQILVNEKEWVPPYKYEETFLQEGDTLSLVILLPGG
jgi:molybdopterin converting factor small subunit